MFYQHLLPSRLTACYGLLLALLPLSHALGDGDEILGPPSIPVDIGPGFAAGGVGLDGQTGASISVNVPGTPAINQVLLYWSGRISSGDGDDTVTVDGTSVTGILIGAAGNSRTYRADITSLGLVGPGLNTIELSDVNYDFRNDGAGVLVVYDDGSGGFSDIRDGNDSAFEPRPPPGDVTVPQSFTFPSSTVDRTAKVISFLSDGVADRPDELEITVGTATTVLSNVLVSADGNQWDTLIIDVPIPAGETTLTLQHFSRGGSNPDSLYWHLVTVALEPPPTSALGDFVWNDLDADGIQDGGEPGIPNVMVNLYDCEGAFVETTMTDALGFYLFDDLAPGCYRVEFIAPGGFAFSPQNQGGNEGIDSDADPTTGFTDEVTLGPAETNLDVDAGLFVPPSAEVGDRFWEDRNGNGIQDPGEPGIPGVTVRLLDCLGDPLAGTTTDGLGMYLFPDLAAGCYIVEFEPPANCELTLRNAGADDTADSDADPLTGRTAPVDLEDMESDLTQDAGCYFPAGLGDFVWNDLNRDGIQDPGEPGIPGLTVELLDADMLPTGLTTLTGPDGEYAFTGLAPGAYFVQFSQPPGFVFSPQNQGGDDALDSDANGSGKSDVVVLGSGEFDPTIDAGVREPADPQITIEKSTNGFDADDPTGPFVPVGGDVLWEYVVTNTGNVDLFNVLVTDDQDVSVSCPQDTLAIGESFTCTASSDDAQAGQYRNLGKVCADADGTPDRVCDDDPSHYFGADPGIDIEKATNGEDADEPTGPFIPVGNPVVWTYVVTNTGNVTLSNVMVDDDQGIGVTCPVTTLVPGQVITCFAFGEAIAGQYANIGSTIGDPPVGPPVTDEDPSHYFGARPAIDIEKSTNGEDADNPTGPLVPVGGGILWEYVVTNTGNVPLTGVIVFDNRIGIVRCPTNALEPAESMTCRASGVAAPGQYQNRGITRGRPPTGRSVTDRDPSHYFGVIPGLTIEKRTNGVDADDPDAGDAPQIMPGNVVTWRYIVTNTGNVPLSNVTVEDDQGVAVSCPSDTLAPGASFICTASGLAENLLDTAFTTVPGLCGGFPNTPLYENIGTATGETESGDIIQVVDPSHYCNPQEPMLDIEKLTNGVDADDPNAGDAPQIMPGNLVSWSYIVTNTGNVTLSNVTVEDDQGVAVSCPGDTLAPGDSFTCTASGLADDLLNTAFTTVPGLCGGFPNTPLYENMGTATGETESGDIVQVVDPSHYCNPQEPMLDIEKLTNGVDADDPNAGDAPQIMAGNLVSWSYIVTNTGSVALSNVTVTDDQGVAVSCPSDTLAPGDSFICTASGLAENLLNTTFTTVPGLCGGFPNTPLYQNMGTATGQTENGDVVQVVDPSHYCNPQEPMLDIEKLTNDVDADDPNAGDAPQIMPGNLVSWSYIVTNTGNVALSNVTVEDDQGVAVSCPGDTLAPGDSFTCTASGLAENLLNTTFTTVPGLCGGFPNTPLYQNMGTATGQTENGDVVQVVDPSHYCNPQEPMLDIEKLTNDVDADDPNAGDAPQIAPGDPVSWTYVVTNTGNVPLSNVTVTDDQGVAVSCPSDTLAPGASFICTASGLAENLLDTAFTTVPGLCGGFPNTPLYQNMGTATGETENGDFIEDADPSHYCNPQGPMLEIEKLTNDVDADDPNAGDAPQIMAGNLVTWRYIVTNTGNVPLSNVTVTDDQGVAVSCPSDTLAPGDSFTCTASGLAENLLNTTFTTVPGLCGGFPNTPLYQNMGIATGETENGDFIEDDDPSHYCNPQEPMLEIEKLTNDVDADDPNAGDAPQIMPGNLVSWRYIVTNTGNVALSNVTVTDDQGVAVSCPSDTLAPGDSFTCTASGLAENLLNTAFTTVPGLCGAFPNVPLYENMGIATGQTENGDVVQVVDPSHYCNPQEPMLDIEKLTNGVDADDPNAGDAPQIMVGNTVTWRYIVTNTGNTPLINVTVTDDQGVSVSCPDDALAPGVSFICTASAAAENLLDTTFTTVPGLCGGFPNTPLYENMGTATGQTVTGGFVQDEDPSHYCNPQVPMLEIEKLTNGVDADDPNAGDAPQLAPGDPVNWTYIVTNNGNAALTGVTVIDDQGVTVTCPQDTLAPGESIVCTASGFADDLLNTGFTTVPGLCGGVPNVPLYQNMGTATGQTSSGDFVQDIDASHYCNVPACDVGVVKTCLIPVPPAGDYVCDTPIDSLTMIWDGNQAVRIKAWKGNVGSTLLADIDDVQPGEEITVMGFAGSPNDVTWEVFTAGTNNKIGESVFHLSCSDNEMNGPEDCGNREGNGKGNDGGLINDWLLEGIVDAGGVLDCTQPPPDPGVSECEFQQFPASCETSGQPDTLTFLYSGGGCAASDNDQTSYSCTETGGGIDDGAPVTVLDDEGDTFTVSPGETFTIALNGAKDILLSNSGGTERSELHVSCSQPIAAGDVYGGLTLVAMDGMGVGTNVIYTYVISNDGDVNIVDLSAIDNVLGPVPGTPSSLPAGDSVTLMTSAFLTETTTNTVVVDGDGADGRMCNATDTATVTILPPPPCEVEGEGVLDISSDKIAWDLTNTGAFTGTVQSVSITWPSANGDLIEVKLDGDKIFDDNRSAPSTVIGPNDWIGDLDKRQIPPGDTATLEIKFVNDAEGVASDYSITVNFEEGCSVTFENTGLPFACTQPIDELSMIWDGTPEPVRVKAYKGPIGAELLLDQSGIGVGDELTVSGFAGSPNDVFWEIFNASGTKLGESKFHLSCSDNDMNGAEDCGKRQGNGKDDDGSLINDWLLEGMIDADGPFDCSNLQ